MYIEIMYIIFTTTIKHVHNCNMGFFNLCKIDFTKLKPRILHLMPDDYEPTIGKLQDYISDDQICSILSSSTSTIANKIILDCLIERISCEEQLLDLCDQLESITTSSNMRMVTSEIRLGKYCCKSFIM